MEPDPVEEVAEARPGRALARRLEHVVEPAHRAVLLVEFCDEVGPEAAVAALQDLMVAVVHGAHRASWLAVASALFSGDLHYDVVENLYRRAVEQELPALRLLLIGGDRPYRSSDATDFPRDEVLEGLTLGERKWKARLMNRNLLQRLLFDADPAVVRIVLQNPRATEPDVLRLAARRPNRSEALREIALQPRWIARPPIQRALVQNPYTPLRLALTLMPLLTLPELQGLTREAALHPLIATMARHVLALRHWREPVFH